MSYISLDNISFAYENESTLVFKSFSASIEKGKCVFVEGDNGSGKTTLLRILSGLSFPQTGTYTFEDTEITSEYLKNDSNAKLFHKKVGFLFQNPDIMLFNARVYDEIAFGPRQMGLSDSEVDKRVQDLLTLFDIKELSGKAPYHLSGGQKKKVALASVMALNPDVLILDEPYDGLDRKSKEWLTSFLEELKTSGKTLIIATHDTSLTKNLMDTTIRL